eukprot:532438-Pelagomonas_calceolata.AAC.1
MKSMPCSFVLAILFVLFEELMHSYFLTSIMLLPSQMGWTKKGYMHWFSCYPDHATVLTKFPSESLTIQPTQVHLPPTPPEKNMKHMQLIAISNNEGKQRRFQNEPNWLEGLHHEIP